MSVYKINIIGFHGTDNATLNNKNELLFDYNRGDLFLGRGYYLFRDSYQRAIKWTKNRHKSKKSYILQTELEVNEDEILNFCTTFDKEFILKFYGLYHRLCRDTGVYLGTYIDFLIDKLNLNIKVVMAIDLQHENIDEKIIFIQDGNYATHFAVGDIQVCVKEISVIKDHFLMKEIDG